MMMRAIGLWGAAFMVLVAAGCAGPGRFCGDPCGTACVTGGCGSGPCAGSMPARVRGRTPVEQLRFARTCGAGCGNIYWGEWFFDPPNAYDPCDDGCFGWTGPRCRPVRGVLPFPGGLFGRRFGDDCAGVACGPAGCEDGCAGGCSEVSGDEEVLWDDWESTDALEVSSRGSAMSQDSGRVSRVPTAVDRPAGPATKHPHSRLVRQTR